jgi:hypothetical protein
MRVIRKELEMFKCPLISDHSDPAVYGMNAGIVGLNPTWGMDVCVCLFCVCVACVQTAALRQLILHPKTSIDCVKR